MNDIQATAPGDPAMFEPLTGEENGVLRAYLTSGWHMQASVYPARSEPWRESEALLDDLHEASRTSRQAGQEPEAGQ